MRVMKRIEGRVSSTMSGIDYVAGLAEDAILDAHDGFDLEFIPRENAPAWAVRFVSSVVVFAAEYMLYVLCEYVPLIPKREKPTLDLTWIVGEPIPVRVRVDLTADVLPPRVAKFIGGPSEFDGKEFIVSQGKTELTLTGGNKYRWDGKAFVFVPPEK